MKVNITEDSKRLITLNDIDGVKKMIKDLKEANAADDLEILANVFHAKAPKEYKAEIAKNCRIYNRYNDESKDFDVWLTVTLGEVFDTECNSWAIYKIGCYLSDIWEINSENREEIKKHMYIRKFIEC